MVCESMWAQAVHFHECGFHLKMLNKSPVLQYFHRLLVLSNAEKNLLPEAANVTCLSSALTASLPYLAVSQTAKDENVGPVFPASLCWLYLYTAAREKKNIL